MKWFFAVLITIFLAVPVSGVAQEPQNQSKDAQSKPAAAPPPVQDTVPAANSAKDTPAGNPSKDAAVSGAAETPPASPAANTPATPAFEANTTRYIIGPEDNLQITVWREPQISGTVPVRPDGMISMVLVGDLKAAGLTPMQLSTDIGQHLKKYIQDPNVSVIVLGVNSQRIFMIGEVGHVGPVMLTSGMTPLQAIATAGGLGPFANSKKIYILRNEGGKQEKIPFNYKQALKGEDKQGVTLRPGDTIVVP